MKKTHDIVCTTGTYTDNQGNQKSRYQRCGTLLRDESTGRLSIAFDGIPSAAVLHAAKEGKDTIWLGCFEPEDNGQQQPQNRQPVNSGTPAENNW